MTDFFQFQETSVEVHLHAEVAGAVGLAGNGFKIALQEVLSKKDGTGK